jgi:hypothetical protein
MGEEADNTAACLNGNPKNGYPHPPLPSRSLFFTHGFLINLNASMA